MFSGGLIACFYNKLFGRLGAVDILENRLPFVLLPRISILRQAQ